MINEEAPPETAQSPRGACPSIEYIDGEHNIINYRFSLRLDRFMGMDTAAIPPQRARGIWSRVCFVLGSAGMVLGALDPIEGSVVILGGSGLVALGTFLSQKQRQWLAYRLSVFLLIVFGVAAMWGLSLIGGIGGNSGHSMWWGILVLPYLIGWWLGMWGPGLPRWFLLLGIVAGLWYLALCGMVLNGAMRHNTGKSMWPGIIIGILGLLTIGGCIIRLFRRAPA